MDLDNEEILVLVDMSREFAGGESNLKEIVESHSELFADLIETSFHYYARNKNRSEGTEIKTQDLFGNKAALRQAIIESLDQ